MKAVLAAFNQEKALVGAFSVITNLRMELFEALVDMLDGGAHLLAVPGLVQVHQAPGALPAVVGAPGLVPAGRAAEGDRSAPGGRMCEARQQEFSNLTP